jgi:hypothetical protein
MLEEDPFISMNDASCRCGGTFHQPIRYLIYHLGPIRRPFTYRRKVPTQLHLAKASLMPLPEAYYPTLKTTLILSQNIPPAVFLTIFVFFLPRKLGICVFSVEKSTYFAEFLEEFTKFSIAQN